MVGECRFGGGKGIPVVVGRPCFEVSPLRVRRRPWEGVGKGGFPRGPNVGNLG